MKELRATVSDEEFAELEHLAQVLGVPLDFRAGRRTVS